MKKFYPSATFVSIFIFLLAPFFSSADCSDPTCANAVFCSGFEEGNKSVWSIVNGNADYSLLMSDPGPCNKAGNHIMRFRVPTGQSGTTGLVKDLSSTYDKLYLRWYQKWEPGYNFAAPNHGGGLYAGDAAHTGLYASGTKPSGSDFFKSTIEPYGGTSTSSLGEIIQGRMHLYAYYPGMYQDYYNGNYYGDWFPCMADEGQNYCENPLHRDSATIMPPRMQTGQWYCIEMMIDAGTPSASSASASGIQDFWIDNVEYGPWNNLWLRTTSNLKLRSIWMRLYHHDSTHSTEGIMLDNVVVSTTRIGCLDFSAPNSPQGMEVH